MHLVAGWSFRHRRTVLTGWLPPYSPAKAGQMNASRTVAFASLAPVAAAQDAPAAARPSVAGPPRGTARRRQRAAASQARGILRRGFRAARTAPAGHYREVFGLPVAAVRGGQGGSRRRD
jgi:hypothetical protein